MNIKRATLLLSLLACASSASASSFYLLGQAGGFKAYNSGGKSVFTGRIGTGYGRSVAINLRAEDEDHLFFCFNYGIELAYQGYQNKTDGKTVSSGSGIYSWNSSYQRNTIDLLGFIDYHPLCNVDIFVKLGPALVFQKSAYHYISSVHSADRDQTICRVVPKGIIGIGYDILPRININIAFLNEFETSAVENAKSFMGGLQFRFV